MLSVSGYNVIEKLTTGKKVDTYRCIRSKDKRSFILKVPSQEQPDKRVIANLIHEYNLLKKLTLPGIIKADTLLQITSHPILVLEDIGGQTLHAFLNHQPLNLTDFFSISLQLIDIVASLHQRNIIHKDINPSNILIDPHSLKVKLIDFGIASELKEEIQQEIHPNKLEGTLSYISPEQTGRVNIPIDYRTDFYSLGIMFFEMLTGSLPFKEEDMLELIYSHLAKTPPAVSSLNPEVPNILNQLVKKLLSKQPDDRYANIFGIKADVVKCANQWQQFGKIADFTLGQRDIYDRLKISHKLYGHENEIQQLLDAFSNICEDNREIIFISGYSGIGKTTLVKELYKPLVSQHAYFIQGKFDLLHRTTPYSALIEAMNGLINRILEEPEERLLYLKKELLKVLGNNAQVIIQVIPALEHVIGSQPNLPLLPELESQTRFMITFQSFMRCIVKLHAPFVIFLDDMQWADSASLELLRSISLDVELKKFMFIGSYRNNEVSENHIFKRFQAKLTQGNLPFHEIVVMPLTEINVQFLLADSLNCSIDKIIALANLIVNKTQGNPFFINEFIKMLYQKKLITFSYEENQWSYDIEQIKQQAITDNVVDLLLNQIKSLPIITQNIIKIASSIGHQFDLTTLAMISEQSLFEVIKQLYPAVQNNLIIPVNENFRYLLELTDEFQDIEKKSITFKFSHDRIQAAAYQFIPPEERSSLHLKVGRLMLKSMTENDKNNYLFDILNHFDQCLQLVTNPNEKLSLANLYFLAGKKAKFATAYQIAKEKIGSAIQLLSDQAWNTHYQLKFNMHKEFVECEYLTGNSNDAIKHLADMLTHVTNLQDKIAVYELQITVLVMLNKQADALKLGLMTLQELGIIIPEKVGMFHLIKALLAIKWEIGFRKIEDIELKPVTDSNVILINRIAQQLITIIYTTNIKLFALLILTLLKLNLHYGYTSETPYILLFYSTLLLHQFKDYDKAFKFVDLAQKISSHFQEITSSSVKEYVALGTMLSNWKYPFAEARDVLTQGYQIGLDTGSLLYANYCRISCTGSKYLLGVNLPETLEEVKNSQLFQRSNNITQMNDYFSTIETSIAYLTTEKDLKKAPSIYNIIRSIENHDQKSDIAILFCLEIKLRYLYGRYKEVIELWPHFEINKILVSGTTIQFLSLFYYAMSLANLYNTAPYKVKRTYLKKIMAAHRQFVTWSKWCPVNFDQYKFLLEAEIESIKKNYLTAMKYFNKSIQFAFDGNNLLMQAIANESAGKFYLKLENILTANTYMQNAQRCYERWGASGLAKRIRTKYKRSLTNLFTNLPSNDGTIKLTTESEFYDTDIVSILKSNQVISDEIHFDKLLKKLLHIILQNSGAQRAILLSVNDNKWFVEAEGSIDNQQIYLQPTVLIQHRKDLPSSLINYVQRTNEALLIQDAELMEQEAMNDQYLETIKPKSLLLLPILHHSQLKYIIFLENRILNQAFTQTQIHTLKLLSSQVAISLENAKLYYQATHDPLTSLGNRNLLYPAFNQATTKAKLNNTLIAIFFIDLDGFKAINDKLGHEIGDKLLISYAQRLENIMQKNCMIVRLGGDEFVVMLEDINNIKSLDSIAKRLMEHLSEPHFIDGNEIRIFASIGISIFPTDSENIAELLKQADIALYQVKDHGKRNYYFYSPQMITAMDESSHENELRRAMEKQHFSIFYQPIYSARDHHITHFEALIRWHHQKKGIISAEQFIPLAESMGLINQIGEWVIKQICFQLQSWKQLGLKILPIAINISGSQLKNHFTADLLERYTKEYEVDPHHIELEITESIFIDQNTIQEDIVKLKALGVKLTLDDFGTCYSSFSYLRRFAIGKIKIEKSFVKDILNNEQDRLIVLAIINIAHSLNLQVVAEGVETEEQAKLLISQDIDELQGFYLSQPLDVKSCTEVLKVIY